jgi:hypothetical protein
MRLHGWLAVVLIGSSLATSAQAQMSLRWKFKEGDTFFVEEKVSAKQTVKIRGSAERQELEQTKISRFKVLKATPDGGAILEQKIEAVRATPHGATAKADASVLRRFVGATFRITLDGRQRLTQLEGYKQLVEALARENADHAKLLRALLTEDSLRRPLEGLLAFAPEKPVAKGGTWTIKSTEPFGPLGTLHLVDTYTLQGEEPAEKDAVKVTVTTAATYTLPEEGGVLRFKVLSGDVKVQEAKGSLLFNPTAGRLLRRETQRTLRAFLTIGLADQRLDMEVEQQQSITTRVLESNPLSK